MKRLAGRHGVAADAIDEKRLRKEIEGWYDGAMDRASGWFKRHTQRNLFVMGLIAAMLLNINAVSIAQYLNSNRAQRERLVSLAATTTQATGQGQAGGVADPKKFQDELYDTGLPFGWSAAARTWTLREFELARTRDQGWVRALSYSFAGIGLLVGYLMTALATMLGAPFWFDILNRLMVIRSTVKPKEKSPDEPPVDK